jgi:uncharacterized protein (UPF0218 family)
MKILVNNKKKQLREQAIERTTEKVSATFSRFGPKIVSIEVSVSDVNGPRGGVDKECRLLVRLKKMEDVIATVQDVSYTKAIDRAINRASRAVTRKIQRRALRDSDRKKFSFVIYR